MDRSRLIHFPLHQLFYYHSEIAGPGKHLTPQEFHNILAASLKCSQLVETDERMSTRDRSSSNTENDSVGGGSFRGQMDSTHQGSYGGKELVVLDVRNHYETRIGRFQLRNDDRGILPTIVDPQTRQVQSSVLVNTATQNHRNHLFLAKSSFSSA